MQVCVECVFSSARITPRAARAVFACSSGLAIGHCFACDNLPAAKLISDYYFKPNKFFSDIRLRDNESLPSVDLYVSGFPCRAWSQNGTRLGLDNTESGDLAWHSLLYIKQKRPVIVVLEKMSFLVVERV